MMEGDSGIIETSGSKRQKNEDRISSLPDSVLVHILSFLPTVDAMRMVLFPRFGHLWTSIRNLDFNECPYHVCRYEFDIDEDRYHEYGPSLEKRFLNLIRRALVLHQSPTLLQKFRLRFLFSFYPLPMLEDELEDPNAQNLFRKKMRVANEIDTWIRFAIRREVKVLDLNFLACGSSSYDATYRLPDFVLSSDCLTELKLAYCGVELLGKRIHMASLKSLSFKELRLSDTKLEDILHGCPLLEDLFLIECYGLSELNFSIPNLNLTIVLAYEDTSERRVLDEDTSELRVSCRNLMSFNLLNCIKSANLIDLSFLVNATIDFTDRLDYIYDLKIVYIYDFMPQNHVVVELVEFLLKSALILEKMVITSKKNSECYRQDQLKLLEFSQKLSGFPRASTSAVILFS